ncbi:collagen-binding domain-containing protein [Streptomyces sp. BYX5S]
MTKTTNAVKVIPVAGAVACTVALAAFSDASAGLAAVARETVSIGNPVAGNNGFGVVTEGDAVLGSTESEGPVAIGGDLTYGPGYNVALNHTGSYTAPGDSNPTALIVGGGIDYADSASDGVLKVLRDGYVKIGDLSGSRVLSQDSNGAAVNTHITRAGAAYDSTSRIELTTRQSADSIAQQPMDFASLFTTYRARAQSMASCANTVELRDGNDNVLADPTRIPSDGQVRVSLTQGRTNVLRLTGEQLDAIDEITFDNPPSADTPFLVVVDTTGTDSQFTWHTPTLAGVSGAQAPYMLWDFPDATDITIADGDEIEGTVFAPNARITDLDPSNIEGDVIAKELIAGPLDPVTGQSVNAGEIHYFPFDAQLTCDDQPSPSTSPPQSPTQASGSPHPSDSGSPSPSDSGTPTPSPSDSGTPTPSPSPSSESPTPSPSDSGTTTPSPSGSTSAPAPTPTPTSPGGPLAHTGTDGRRAAVLGGIAIVLVAGGAGAVLLGRRHGRGRH